MLFGECAGCGLPLSYQRQLEIKVSSFTTQFSHLPQPAVFMSSCSAFRSRAEFRITHHNNEVFYCLNNRQKQKLIVPHCPILLKPIQSLFEPLRQLLSHNFCLSHRLFSVEFLASRFNEIIISLIYHKNLEQTWEEAARCLHKDLSVQSGLKISLIGRAYKQKKIIGDVFVNETFCVDGESYHYAHYENTFTQPNPFINAYMLQWASNQMHNIEHKVDLLELYCGLGNFTIPLSKCFHKTLATEVSKMSIVGFRHNLQLNNINSISIARLSACEIESAILQVRLFKRLAHVNLDTYHFTTLFVDPPRAGLKECASFASRFKHIMYVSCSPQSLLADLHILKDTHRVLSLALFDQFPYTPHLESIVMLERCS